MSLVNDMLKDLDQRRRESDSSGARVKLTPASEFPRTGKQIPMPALVAVLVLIVSGLGYLWYSSGSSTESVPVNRQFIPAPLAQSAGSSGSGEAERSAGSQTGSAQIAATELSSAELPGGEPADILEFAVNQRTARDPDPTPPVTLENKTGQEGPSQADGTPESRARPDSSLVSSEDQPRQTSIATVSLAPASGDAVKNNAAMSADDSDRLAVQQALRLLADNRVIDAYARLESHILENRYAHQSRETYAKLLLNQGELLAAGNLIEGGLALAPNHQGFKKVKARILLQGNRIAEAKQLLLARAPSVAEDVEYHEILASAQLAGRDFEGAVLSYQGLVQQNQSEGKYWYGFAASQEMLGNHRAAEQAYGQAMQQTSLSASLRSRSQQRLAALSQR